MLRTALSLAFAIALGGSAAMAQATIDFSKPMTGKSIYAVDVDGRPVERGVPQIVENEPIVGYGGSGTDRSAVDSTVGMGSVSVPYGGNTSCGGSHYGATSCATGRGRTVYVDSHVRKDGTVVRGHYRSPPARSGGGRRH